MKQFNLDEYLANPSRKVVTRDGRDVRIICTDFHNESYPIVGEIQGMDTPETFSKEGLLYKWRTDNNDLFFAAEKHEGYINVYRDTDTGTTSFGSVLYASREEAEEVGKPDDYYVATEKIEWEE